MPYTSTQISGLVGGQQVMFANQATFANQIAGESPPQMMSNPYPSPSYGVAGLDPGSPDIGARMAGGMAMALPGIAAGGTMAASLLGYKSPLGLLDPFTGISRAFGAGTGGGLAARAGVMSGAQGMGLQYAWGNVSGAFAQGGTRAALGAIGGGLAGAAAAAVPYYLAGKALGSVAENAYEGVQNIQDVRRMTTQYFEPQFGQPGAGMGGRAAPGMIKNITAFMHEMASEDVMTSMRDMRKVMDKAGQMGMLQGIQDVNQFRERFRNIVRQTRGVAQMLGTTLEEAMPLVGQLQQMGMWTAKDVMGTAAAARAAGPGGAQAMVGAMQQGAQMSYAMGGRLESGARLGQELFGQVSAATRAGVFNSQDIRNMTGGVGGAEGQRMVAGSLQQVFAGFGQTAMGRMMMAGLGEMKGKEFTGRMDQELLAKFNRGEISVGELQARGQRRVGRSQESAASFYNRADELGQSMAEQGGMVGLASGIQEALVRAGRADAPDAIQNKFIQMITGSNQKQANMIQKIIKDLPRIQAEQERTYTAALDDQFRQLNERRNNSLAGLSDAVGAAFREGIGRPIQELSERLTTSMSETTQSAVDSLMGRTKALPRLGIDQKLMLAQTGALGRGQNLSWKGLGIENVGQEFIRGGFMENVIGRVGEQDFGSRFWAGVGAGAATGASVGTLAFGAGALPGAIIGGAAGGIGAALGIGDNNETPKIRALRAAGMRMRAGATEYNPEDAERVSRRSFVRAIDPTMSGLYGGSTAAKEAALAKGKARMTEIMRDPVRAARLDQLREENPEAYMAEKIRLMREDPGTKAAMAFMAKSTPLGKESIESDLDYIAYSESAAGHLRDYATDFQQGTKGLSPASSPKEIEEFREKNIEMMTTAAGGVSSLSGFSRAYAKAGGFFGAISLMSKAKISKGDIEAVLASTDYSKGDIAKTVRALMAGKEGGEGNAFSAASRSRGAASNVFEALKTMSNIERQEFLVGLEGTGSGQDLQFYQERKKRLQGLAEAQGPILGVKGLGGGITEQLERARQKFAEGGMEEGEKIITDIAQSGKLKQSEIDLLLGGRAGVGGVQAGRLATIRRLTSLTEDQVEGQLGKIGQGVNLLGNKEIAAKVSELLARGPGRKISVEEMPELKALLQKTIPGALGEGRGAMRTATQDAQEKYIAATEKFFIAVNKFVGEGKGMDVADTPGQGTVLKD